MAKALKKANKARVKPEEVFDANKIGKLLQNLGSDVKQINGRIDGLDKNIKQINGTIDRLIDGQLNLDKKIDALDEKLSEKIDDLDDRVFSVEKRMDTMEGKMNLLGGRMDSMEIEMKSSFKTVVSYLDSIENEIAEIKVALDKKADKNDLDALEQRVLRLEVELGECKKQIATAKSRP